jgi:hypothetical protein
MTKLMMTSKCTSVVGHFEGLADAPEQYRWHHLMQHVQGYPGSHWMPPSGDYLLCIVTAAARATANKMTTKKWTNFAGHFDGRGGAPVCYRAYPPMEKVQDFTLEATGCCHWASIAANSIKGTWLRQFFSMFFIVNMLKKVAGQVKGPCFQ